MLKSMFKPKGKDSDAVDFGPTSSTQSQTSGLKDSSITLWGPGVKMWETPSSILTQSLDVWRKDNAQLPVAKAAEGLHNMYENLPQEALELTFRDMIARKNPLKGKSNNKAGQNDKSPAKLNTVNGGFVKDASPVKDAAKEKVNASPTVSIFAKIAVMLTPKDVYSSANRTMLAQEDLDRLLAKRRRKAGNDGIREGMYSKSSTPATSFRRVSPITSPKLSPTPSFHELMHRVSPITSPKLSPTASFHECMIQVDGHSFRSKLSNSFLGPALDDYGGMSHVHEGLHHQRALPPSPKRTTRGKDMNDCDTCSTSNLFSLKTTCVSLYSVANRRQRMRYHHVILRGFQGNKELDAT